MESIEERGLRRQHEQVLANAARKAIDENNPVEALSLIERITDCWPQNLITLLSIIGFYADETELKKRASSLFHQHIKLCTNVNVLATPALWLRNPNRAKSFPDRLRNAVDAQRRIIEPTWNGIWQNGGISASNRALVILTKRPEEVFDVNDCLIGATQAGNWAQWINRYCALGGSKDDPRYLKVWVSRAVARSQEPSLHSKRMLRKFTMLGDVPEVRKFLRNITPVCNSKKGKNPNWKLARYALFLYCECERLERSLEDWVHISKSALHLDHRMVQRLSQRILAGLNRDNIAQEIFEELTRRNGAIRVTTSAREDIGLPGNPIWQSVYKLLPIDADAVKILTTYSQSELNS